jgi:hypothetical protein
LPGKRAEYCGLCGVELSAEHAHLVDIATRQLSCACDACAVLFSHRGTSNYRRVGRRVCALPGFQMTDAEWESLLIPIGLAFFVHSTAAGRMLALYPGPAGATESLLPLDSWNPIAARNPALREMEPDIEALLVNRIGAAREHYVAPIDRCYRLVGLIRTHWRGLSGGEEVWSEIGRFFEQLREAADA